MQLAVCLLLLGDRLTVYGYSLFLPLSHYSSLLRILRRVLEVGKPARLSEDLVPIACM